MIIKNSRVEPLSAAIADVMCWFAGFSAANKKATLPPGLNNLREFNCDLKDEMGRRHETVLIRLRQAGDELKRRGLGDDMLHDLVADAIMEIEQ